MEIGENEAGMKRDPFRGGSPGSYLTFCVSTRDMITLSTYPRDEVLISHSDAVCL